MKSLRFLIFLVIVILFTSMSGCSFSTNSKSTLTNGENVKQNKESPFNQLSEEQKSELLKASPQDLIQKYYSAINEKQYDLALACLDPDFIGKDKENMVKYWKEHYKSIENVRVDLPDEFKDRQSTVSAFYQVLYSLELYEISASATTENSGINTRFVHLEKKSNSNRWLITGLGTSP